MGSWYSYLKKGLSRSLPKDQISGKDVYTGLRESLRNLGPFIARQWRMGLIGALLILTSSFLSFLQPLITRYLIDNVIIAKQLKLLASVVLLYAGSRLFSMAAGTLQQYYFTHFEQSVLVDIQRELLNRTLRFPKAFFDDKHTGYLMSRLTSDVQGLRWFFSSTLVHIISNLLSFIGGIVLLFYLERRLALLSLIVLPGLVLGVRYFSSKLRILSHRNMEQQANISQQMQESISANTLIKSFATEGRTVERLVSEWKTARQISLEQVTVGSLANLLIGILPDLTRGIVLVLGGYWAIKGLWTLGSLLAFQSYLGYVFGPAMFLANTNLQLQNALASLERVSTLFDIMPEEDRENGVKVEKLDGKVEFCSVSFAYEKGKPVLNNISFHVEPGEHIAIVGPSGVGKTTLVSLILGFYKPTHGEIRFDDVPATSYNVVSLRQRIGYVSQNTLLLSGTIAENLRYGNLDADQALILHAAQAAGIHEFIRSLPEGYNSVVGERGVNFSEGQKQRLAIARALIKDPDILILDEPTSALDRTIEGSIFDALPEFILDKTLFIVAHRLSTIRYIDRILLLNENQLVAAGTHRELYENIDFYRSMVANQQSIEPA